MYSDLLTERKLFISYIETVIHFFETQNIFAHKNCFQQDNKY